MAGISSLFNDKKNDSHPRTDRDQAMNIAIKFAIKFDTLQREVEVAIAFSCTES